MEIEPGETMTVSYDAPKLELKENDGVVSFRDDFPCYGPLAQRLNSQQKNLIDKVFPTRGIVTDGTTYYLYSNGTGSWAQLYSKTAAYGHFGRDDHDFTWERTDKAQTLRQATGVAEPATA